MKLKSFFADSIEEAIGLARREMGPEAMLVHSKQSSLEARHLGAYEVVCAADTEEPGERVLPARTQQAMAPPVETLVREVSDLKLQMERLSRALTRSGPAIGGLGHDPDLAGVFAALTEHELDVDLIYDAVSRIGAAGAAGSLRQYLQGLVHVSPTLGCSGSQQRIAALVGPPGAGKTSALVKLAVQYGIRARKRVELVSLDTHRIGAAEELQCYAAILGTACQVLESSSELPRALVERKQADLILLDTPGLSGSEMDEELARAIAEIPELDTHLVLPASMRSSDMKRAAEQFRLFQPDKLLFTRLDETRTFGPILSQSVRMAIPVSFLCDGQCIPEDLQAATSDVLLSLIVKSEPGSAPRFGTVAA